MSLFRRTGRSDRPAAPADGWALPPGLASSRPVAAAVLGTVDGAHQITVDGRGLISVSAGGDERKWSLDWWIGGDDRWRLASQESGLRQRLVDAAPVVETAMRIPGGDAVQRVWVVQGQAVDGWDDHAVVEVANDTAVPFVLALVVRPFTNDGWQRIDRVGLTAVEGGAGRDVAQQVDIDGFAAMVLPRMPARVALGDGTHDIDEVVTSGAAPAEWPVDAEIGTGATTAAFLFPVSHRTSVRVMVPLGTSAETRLDWPSVVPPMENVAAGWAAHLRSGTRTEVPDSRLTEGLAACRAGLLLAAARNPGGLRERAQLAQALDGEGFHERAALVLADWPDLLAQTRPTAEAAGMALAAIVGHWQLARGTELVRSLLPEVAALLQLRGRRAAGTAADGESLAEMLSALDQPEAAARARADRLDPSRESAQPPDRWSDLRTQVESASPTWAWPGRDDGGELFLTALRSVLVVCDTNGVSLLPAGVGPWWGQGVELHDAPTRFGLLSFAVRWHGVRPALLWDLQPHPGAGTIELTSSIDPAWRSAERRGETLLEPVPPPDDLGPHAAPIPTALGGAEAVAPRSVLPMAPSGTVGTDRQEAEPPGSGGSFS